MYKHQWHTAQRHYEHLAPDLSEVETRLRRWLMSDDSRYGRAELRADEVSRLLSWLDITRRHMSAQAQMGSKAADRVSHLERVTGDLQVEADRLRGLVSPYVPDEEQAA